MCERGAAIRPHVGIAAVALDHLRAHADDVADLGVYWRRLARTVATNLNGRRVLAPPERVQNFTFSSAKAATVSYARKGTTQFQR